MGLIIKEEEGEGKEQLLVGYPIRKSLFKDGEILHYDKFNKQWVGKPNVSMRGVAVFVSATEPANPQLDDIWIKI